MNLHNRLFLLISLLYTVQSLCTPSLAEQFTQNGYAELCNEQHDAKTFASLYAHFDELIDFLQKNPVWMQTLYAAKERFMRSKDRDYYSTDFFGFYDESKRGGREQIAFYYSIHFHDFILLHYPDFKKAPAILNFFNACLQIHQSYEPFFTQAATELNVAHIFDSNHGHPPILLKAIKYLPAYRATRPHYDGTALSLFLNSTDNRSLLLSPYKTRLTVDDFSYPTRTLPAAHSIILIPGALLTEFSIYPTPHIVVNSGKIRYATVAFAMRPHYIPSQQKLSPLPNFNH